MNRRALLLAAAVLALPRPAAAEPYLAYFPAGEAGLDERGRRMCRQVAAVVNDHPGEVRQVTVRVHLDGAEARSAGVALSEARGRAVIEELRNLGVCPSLIRLEAHVDDEPACARGPDASEALNRRVTVDVDLIQS